MKGRPLFLLSIGLFLLGCNMPLNIDPLRIKAGESLDLSLGTNANLNNGEGKEQLDSQNSEAGIGLFTATEYQDLQTPSETPIITSTMGQSPTLTLTPIITQSPTVSTTVGIPLSRTPTPTSTLTKTSLPQPSLTSTKEMVKTATQTSTPKSIPTNTKVVSPTKTATQTQMPSKTPTSTKTLVHTETKTPIPQNCSPVVNPTFENEVVNLINQERANAGVAPLTIHSSLTSAARSHSQDMACNGFFSHTSPTSGSAFDRILAHGYSYSWAGENIIAGYSTPAYSVAWWMNSQAHKNNILNPNFTNIGIGYAYSDESLYGTYVTANFGSP